MSKVGVEHKHWTLHARFSHVRNTFLNISGDLLAQGVSTRSSRASSLTCHHLRDILEDLCVLLSVLAWFLVLLTKCLKDHNKDISFSSDCDCIILIQAYFNTYGFSVASIVWPGQRERPCAKIQMQVDNSCILSFHLSIHSLSQQFRFSQLGMLNYLFLTLPHCLHVCSSPVQIDNKWYITVQWK